MVSLAEDVCRSHSRHTQHSHLHMWQVHRHIVYKILHSGPAQIPGWTCIGPHTGVYYMCKRLAQHACECLVLTGAVWAPSSSTAVAHRNTFAHCNAAITRSSILVYTPLSPVYLCGTCPGGRQMTLRRYPSACRRQSVHHHPQQVYEAAY